MDYESRQVFEIPAPLKEQMQQFSARVTPLTKRKIINEGESRPNKFARVFFFLLEISIPVISNILAKIIYLAFYTGRLFGYSKQFLSKGFQVSNFVSKTMFFPGFLTYFFLKRIFRQKLRKLHLLFLHSFNLITADELWQMNQFQNYDKWKYKSSLIYCLCKMNDFGHFSTEEAQIIHNIIENCYTWYGLDHILEFFVHKAFGKFCVDIENFATLPEFLPKFIEVYHKKRRETRKKWIKTLESLDDRLLQGEHMRQILYEYKLAYMSWILQNREMGGVTEQQAEKSYKKFDCIWEKVVEKTPMFPQIKLDKKISILIASATGGQGMEAGVQAFKQHFANDGYINAIYPFEKVDWVAPLISCNQLTPVKIWDLAFQHQSTCCIWFMLTILSPIFHKLESKRVINYIEKKIKKLIKKGQKPDIFIFFIPCITTSLQYVARKYQIPLVGYCADMTSNLYNDFDSSDTNFYIRIPFLNYRYIERSEFHFHNVRPGQLVFSGYQLRSNLNFSEKDHSTYRSSTSEDSERLIEHDLALYSSFFTNRKTIITLSMGSQPSFLLGKYADALIKNGPVLMHLILITGKNTNLFVSLTKKYEQHTLDKHISVSVLGFTDKFIDIIKESDIVLIKSGGASALEAWSHVKPRRLFVINTLYFNEKGNCMLTKDFKFGDIVYSPLDFTARVNEILDSQIGSRTMTQELLLRPCIELKYSFSQMLSIFHNQ